MGNGKVFLNGDGAAARPWCLHGSEVEIQMDTLTPSGVTDSSCLCLRLIYTPGCLALITSVM